MNGIFKLIKENEIFNNGEITLNRLGNVKIKINIDSQYYTIYTVGCTNGKYWIRACKYGKCGALTAPYRLHCTRVKNQYGYDDIKYTFNTAEEVYNYFCNFWKKYKINK